MSTRGAPMPRRDDLAGSLDRARRCAFGRQLGRRAERLRCNPESLVPRSCGWTTASGERLGSDFPGEVDQPPQAVLLAFRQLGSEQGGEKLTVDSVRVGFSRDLHHDEGISHAASIGKRVVHIDLSRSARSWR